MIEPRRRHEHPVLALIGPLHAVLRLERRAPPEHVAAGTLLTAAGPLPGACQVGLPARQPGRRSLRGVLLRRRRAACAASRRHEETESDHHHGSPSSQSSLSSSLLHTVRNRHDDVHLADFGHLRLQVANDRAVPPLDDGAGVQSLDLEQGIVPVLRNCRRRTPSCSSRCFTTTRSGRKPASSVAVAVAPATPGIGYVTTALSPCHDSVVVAFAPAAAWRSSRTAGFWPKDSDGGRPAAPAMAAFGAP